MKGFLTLAIALGTLLTFVSVTDAHNYKSKILSRCSCGQPVYAYYRPVQYYQTRTIYGWVPAYHNHQTVRYTQPTVRYSQPSVRTYTTSPHSRVYSNTSRYGRNSGITSYRSSPGISLRSSSIRISPSSRYYRSNCR